MGWIYLFFVTAPGASPEPSARTFPTSFRVDLVAAAEATPFRTELVSPADPAVEPARTRVLDL